MMRVPASNFLVVSSQSQGSNIGIEMLTVCSKKYTCFGVLRNLPSTKPSRDGIYLKHEKSYTIM